jgi:hypothetical protein
MMPGRPPLPRRRTGLLVVAGALAILVGFMAGPSGLVNLAIRRHRAARIERQIAQLHREIAAETARRDWLANPDSAKALARHLLAPDSTAH